MKTLIVGQGAIGLLWYAQLHQAAPQDVQLLVSSSANKHVSHLTFTDIHKRQIEVPLHFASPDFITQCELVIICVKAFQLTQALAQISALVSEKAIIVLCHNGLISIEQLTLGMSKPHTLLSMITTHGSKRIAPFCIEHTGTGHVDIGIRQGNIPTSLQTQILQHLSRAIPPIRWHTAIKKNQWKKLAINCVINPICTVNNSSNKVVLEEQYQVVIKAILEEFIDIAAQHHMTFNIKSLTTEVLTVAKLTSQNICSTLADIKSGRPTEIDYINGFLHSEGKKLGIATPTNTMMWQKVRQLSQVINN